MNIAGGSAECDPNENLLCWICEPKQLFFCKHVEVISGIFPAHTPHFVFIQTGNQGAVFVVAAQHLDPNERMDVLEITLKEAVDMVLTGKINANFTAHLILTVARMLIV